MPINQVPHETLGASILKIVKDQTLSFDQRSNKISALLINNFEIEDGSKKIVLGPVRAKYEAIALVRLGDKCGEEDVKAMLDKLGEALTNNIFEILLRGSGCFGVAH